MAIAARTGSNTMWAVRWDDAGFDAAAAAASAAVVK